MNIDRKRRVLIVEDEAMISMLIEDMVRDLGYDVVGPATRIENATALALQAVFDVAVLDISISGSAVYPVADVLRSRGIPFIFASGYDFKALPERFEGSRTLPKPFSDQTLCNALVEVFAESYPTQNARCEC